MKTWKKIMIASFAFVGFGIGTSVVQADAWQDMYRLYNPNSGEHFYTANSNEKAHLQKVGWRYEGVGWVAPLTGKPVYRLYNPNAGDHHYTMNLGEQKSLLKVGWKDEGIGWYSDANEGIKVWRAYNPNAKTGSHNYTINPTEQQLLIIAGWKDEGIGWYGVDTEHPGKKPLPHPGQGFDNHTDEPNDKGNDSFPPIIYVKPGEEPNKPTQPDNPVDKDNNGNEPIQIPGLDLPDIEPEPDNPVTPNETFDGRAVAEEVFRLVNEERRNVGVPELKWNEKLYQASLIRSNEIVKSMSHTRPNGKNPKSVLLDFGFEDIKNNSQLIVGENILTTPLINNETNKLARKLFEQWKASPGHYANIVNEYVTDYGGSFILAKTLEYTTTQEIFGQQYFTAYIPFQA